MRRCARFAALASFAVALVSFAARPAQATEVWKVTGGRTTFNFYTGLMHDLGISLDQVDLTASTPDPVHMDIQPPYWSVAIRRDSDLEFQVESGRLVYYGFLGGAIRHQGGWTFRDATSGTSQELRDFQIEYIDQPNDGPGGKPDPVVFFARNDGSGAPIILTLADEMPIFRPEQNRLVMYVTAEVSAEWARELGRPWLEGQPVARVEISADAEYVSGVSTQSPFTPDTTGVTDVKLGLLNGIAELGHVGTYPNGEAGLSMSTTSCNVGTVDVPWLAPMQTDHPGIAMSLFRLMNGRLEQVGTSWIKHGFYALSYSQCTPCQHPSDGTFLGVGCSDTYSSGNNGDRTYLGPRREWNPFKGTWNCVGSYFAGYVPDCVRRVGGGGLDDVAHRLVVKDADLGLIGATYYYEAGYVVRGDAVKHNNYGSRSCSMTWTGTMWTFTTGSDTLREGPAIERWGDMRTQIAMAPDDGQIILAVQAVNVLGHWHYEYALYNFDSQREVQQITIPVGASTNITNIGFHDPDSTATDDWAWTLSNGQLTWSTTAFAQDTTANAITFGEMFNFRFDSDVAPGSGNAMVTSWRPGAPGPVAVATETPLVATSVATAPSGGGSIHLRPAQPNPLDPATSINFDLDAAASVKLEIYGADGRRVTTLLEGSLSQGPHSARWDGTDAAGSRVSPGVYYYRLTAGREVAAQSLVVIR